MGFIIPLLSSRYQDYKSYGKGVADCKSATSKTLRKISTPIPLGQVMKPPGMFAGELSRQ